MAATGTGIGALPLGRGARLADAARGGLRGVVVGQFAVYGLILVSSCMQMAIAPLLPGYVAAFRLSGLETGGLVAATGLATLAVALPAGALSDRLGSRRLTLISGALLVAAAAGQAAATSFPLLIASRLLFGAGYGVIWT